jgi:micrococcal nuclease
VPQRRHRAGDTLELSTGEQVRLIGVDTPETKHPRKPVQAFGQEASAFTTQLVEGKKVRLEFDVRRKDKYRRTLAYVYVEDLMLNLELVRHGYAQVATVPPNVKYQELFLNLQREAREAKRGLWGL